jgi:hypothetical protein
VFRNFKILALPVNGRTETEKQQGKRNESKSSEGRKAVLSHDRVDSLLKKSGEANEKLLFIKSWFP